MTDDRTLLDRALKTHYYDSDLYMWNAMQQEIRKLTEERDRLKGFCDDWRRMNVKREAENRRLRGTLEKIQPMCPDVAFLIAESLVIGAEIAEQTK